MPPAEATVEAAPREAKEPADGLPPPSAPSPKVTKVAAGARKVRPYCEQPDACVAPSRGPCRWCQADSYNRLREGRKRAHEIARGNAARSGGEEPPTLELADEAASNPGEAGGGSKTPPSASPTGAELAAELDRLIAQHGLSKSLVSAHLFSGATGAIEKLRRATPRQKTVDRIRAFIADPPLEDLRPKDAPLGDRRFAAKRRDPTQPPATPLMDAGDRVRVKAQRQASAARRALEQTATRLVDAGADPTKQNPQVRAQMQEIDRRRANEARQQDPVERAKLALQQKGLVVYSASVSGGRKDRFIVSGQQKELTPAELIDLAGRKTGQTFRRSKAA